MINKLKDSEQGQNEHDMLIKCENVSKKFCKNFKQSLVYGLKDIFGAGFGKHTHHNRLRKNEFWAVKNINFSLKRGECLGLIGHNGAGKSTLLKMLNGLITPDQGKITMRGRIGALIELGAGFNPILTGRENVYNNGAVLGFTKEEIDEKIEQIIDFSEIGEFIDSPVQNYSSGMKVRLGFAVAAQMEPDILLIDEVLAVGDVSFRVKCLNRIAELIKNCAVIFVSHIMPQISRICTSAIVLERGCNISLTNDLAKAIEIYLAKTPDFLKASTGNGNAEFIKIGIAVNNKPFNFDNSTIVETYDTIRFRFTLTLLKDIEQFYFRLVINDIQLRHVLETYSETFSNLKPKKDEAQYTFEMEVPNVTLASGKHFVTFAIANKSNGEFYSILTDAITFFMKAQEICAATNYIPGKCYRVID